METKDDKCKVHDAGGGGLPCPWPDCGIGSGADRISFGNITYKRVLNRTDDKAWFSWQLIRTR